MVLQKNSGQLSEPEAEAMICIIDNAYGKSGVTEEDGYFDATKAAFELKYQQSFEEVDVAPGYSIPAYATLVQIASETWPYAVATFFLAKPIKENFAVWIGAAKSIRRFFKEDDVVLGRNAAAVLAVDTALQKVTSPPKEIECISYYWVDRRFEGSKDETPDVCKVAPSTEYLSMAIQVFYIRVDNTEFKVSIEGKLVTLEQSK